MSNEIRVKFTGDQSDLKRTVGQVKAEIAGIKKTADSQRGIISSLISGVMKFKSAGAAGLEGIAGAAAEGSVAMAALGVAAGVAALGVGAVAVAVNRMGAAWDKFGHIEDISERTGLSPEFLQKLSDAADQSGTSIDAIAKGVAKFSRELINSKNGDEFSDKISGLGLNITELRRQNPEELFSSIANAIGSIEDPTRRAAAAQNVFGKSGAELIPVIANIGAALQSTGQLTADQVDRIDAAGDAWQQFKNDTVTAGGALLSDLGPSIVWVINKLREMTAGIRAVGGAYMSWRKGESFMEAISNAGAVVGQKIAEIESVPSTKKARADADSQDDTVLPSDSKNQSKLDDSFKKTPQELAYEAFTSDPASMKGGRFRNPARARRMKREADLSRARADRANARGQGGPVTQSEENHPNATNLAQANGMYGGTTTAAGSSLLGKSPTVSANDLAHAGGFYKNDASERAKRAEAAKALAASTKAGMMGDGTKPKAQDAQNDPLSSMAADIKSLKETIDKRLPKESTK